MLFCYYADFTMDSKSNVIMRFQCIMFLQISISKKYLLINSFADVSGSSAIEIMQTFCKLYLNYQTFHNLPSFEVGFNGHIFNCYIQI